VTTTNEKIVFVKSYRIHLMTPQVQEAPPAIVVCPSTYESRG